MLINPQQKTNIKDLFSIIGSEKLKKNPKKRPNTKIMSFSGFVLFVLFIKTYKLPRIRPKKTHQTYNSNLLEKNLKLLM